MKFGQKLPNNVGSCSAFNAIDFMFYEKKSPVCLHIDACFVLTTFKKGGIFVVSHLL